RAKQNHKILHASRKCSACDQPQSSRQITELRRERRPNQRPRPRDRCKVVPKQNPFVCRNKIAAVVISLGRRRARIVKRNDSCGQECRIQPVGNQIATSCSNNEPSCTDSFVPVKGDCSEGGRTEARDGNPYQNRACLLHLGELA